MTSRPQFLDCQLSCPSCSSIDTVGLELHSDIKSPHGTSRILWCSCGCVFIFNPDRPAHQWLQVYNFCGEVS
jgi:hypothetical protein